MRYFFYLVSKQCMPNFNLTTIFDRWDNLIVSILAIDRGLFSLPHLTKRKKPAKFIELCEIKIYCIRNKNNMHLKLHF